MLLEAETNKYCPGGYDIGAISNLITWVLNFFLSADHVYWDNKDEAQLSGKGIRRWMNTLNSHSLVMVYYACIRTNVLVIQQDSCTVRGYDLLVLVHQARCKVLLS